MMYRNVLYRVVFAILLALNAHLAAAAAPTTGSSSKTTNSSAPVLFYTDIDSGPATGGEGGLDGAFVCVYGEHFGAIRGDSAITIGGVEAAVYKVWVDPGTPYTPGSYAKACIQISRLSASGPQPIRLTSPAGTSNTLPFTIRPGAIRWVTPAGSDSKGNGSEEKPWASISRCSATLQPGDICLIGNGETMHNTGWPSFLTGEGYIALELSSSGTPGNPKTIVAYPGATVKVDVSGTWGMRALETFWEGHDVSYWTIAGILFDGGAFAVELNRGSHIRFVDNDVMCTSSGCIYGNGNGGGFVTSGYPGHPSPGKGDVSYLLLYGNRFHEIGNGKCGKMYHNVYFSSSTNHVWFGWNSVDGSKGGACRGVQFHNTTPDGDAGIGQWDLHVFNNVIHDTACDGLNFATVDPSQGATDPVTGVQDGTHYGVEAFDNVIYNTGERLPFPWNLDGEAHYSCIYSPGSATSGGGTIQVYNNTLYNCGNNPKALSTSDRAAVAVGGERVQMELTNNIIVQTANIPYLRASKEAVSGSRNDCYGIGACPAELGTSMSVNPNFVRPGTDFHLLQGSPVGRVSTSEPAAFSDLDGVSQSSPYSLGASE
jgi:hypothetical protein